MDSLLSPTSLIWLALCGIGGWLAGATIIRIGMPISVPDTFATMPNALKMKMNAGGLGGFVVAGLFGASLLWLDASFVNANGVGPTLLRIFLFIVSWSCLGTLLAFAVVVNDYHEVLVAMYDFSGTPWLMGGTLGGAVGGILAIIRLAPADWWLALLWGGLSFAGGTLTGFVVAVVLKDALRQYMLKLREKQNLQP